MTNKYNTVLYVGVTSDIKKRVSQHKSAEIDGFTKRYNCNKLVYFEECQNVKDAIKREKQLKKWQRAWKNELVNKVNKNWNDIAV